MFVSPVTLQIVLSHFGDVKLSKKSKKENAKYVYDLTKIENDDAKEEQIKQLINKINTKNYIEMKERIKDISTNYHDIPSTNVLCFFNRFESEDSSWIDEINEQISSCW